MPETDKPALDSTDAPRIALPKDLGRTLQFLSDDDLETLLASVEAERARRIPKKVPAIQSATSAGPSRSRRQSAMAVPAGKASLIRASYHAGMKPAAIARTLRMSVSLVNQVLGAEHKSKP